MFNNDCNTKVESFNNYLESKAIYSFDDIIYKSTQMDNLIKASKEIANSPSTILVTGESGSGKELLAQAIHNESKRKDKPFIAVNCGAIPKNLIESELFGYEEGSFTGAKKGGFKGKFELANEGTIFLDEIGEMPLNMQVNLLRVLQEGYITRVGGKENIKLDIRVICATNRNLKDEIKLGNFREDLYYRISVIPIKVPPLKSRIGDVPLLIDYFLKKKSKKLKKEIPYISPMLYQKMIAYCWPGNVRELENCVENIVNLKGKTTFEINFDECTCMTVDNLGNEIKVLNKMFSIDSNIDIKDLDQRNNKILTSANDKINIHKAKEESIDKVLFSSFDIKESINSCDCDDCNSYSLGEMSNLNKSCNELKLVDASETLDTLNLKELEKRAIIKALNVSELNVTKASKLLGISRNTLYNKMKKYSINQIKEIRI